MVNSGGQRQRHDRGNESREFPSYQQSAAHVAAPPPAPSASSTRHNDALNSSAASDAWINKSSVSSYSSSVAANKHPYNALSSINHNSHLAAAASVNSTTRQQAPPPLLPVPCHPKWTPPPLPPPPPPPYTSMSQASTQHEPINRDNSSSSNSIHNSNIAWGQTSRNATLPSNRWGPRPQQPRGLNFMNIPPPPPPRAPPPPPPPPPLPQHPPPPPPRLNRASATASSVATMKRPHATDTDDSGRPHKIQRELLSQREKARPAKERSMQQQHVAIPSATHATSSTLARLDNYKIIPPVATEEREQNWMTESSLNQASASLGAVNGKEKANANPAVQIKIEPLDDSELLQPQQNEQERDEQQSQVQANIKIEPQDDVVVAGQFEDAMEDEKGDGKESHPSVQESEEEMAISADEEGNDDDDEVKQDDQFEDAPHDDASIWLTSSSLAPKLSPVTTENQTSAIKSTNSNEGESSCVPLQPIPNDAPGYSGHSSTLSSPSGSIDLFYDSGVEWSETARAAVSGDLEAAATTGATVSNSATLDPKLALERARARLREAQERQLELMKKPNKASLEQAKFTLRKAIHQKRIMLKTMQPNSSRRAEAAGSLPPIAAICTNQGGLVIRDIFKSGPIDLIRLKQKFDANMECQLPLSQPLTANEAAESGAATQEHAHNLVPANRMLLNLQLLRKRLELKQKTKKLKESKQLRQDNSAQDLESQEQALQIASGASEPLNKEGADDVNVQDLVRESSDGENAVPSAEIASASLGGHKLWDKSEMMKHHQIVQRRVEISRLQQMKSKQEHLLSQEDSLVQEKKAQLEICQKAITQDEQELSDLEQSLHTWQTRRGFIEDRMSEAATTLISARKRILELRSTMK